LQGVPPIAHLRGQGISSVQADDWPWPSKGDFNRTKY
jgi:hypothetical protein